MSASLCKYFVLIVFFCAHPLFAQIDVGLIVHYPLNGNTNDASINLFNGIDFNATWGPNSTMIEDGALVADGNSTYVELPNEPELKPQFPITVSVRANFFSVSGQQVIFTNDFANSTHSGIWFQIAPSGNFTASYGNAGGGFNAATRHAKSANYTIEPNTWYVITAIYRGMNDIDIYINCELVNGSYTGNANALGYTDAPGNLCRKHANPVNLGLPPHYYDGSMYDFRMWNRELTEAEILSLCTVECTGEVSATIEAFCAGSPGMIAADLSQIGADVAIVEWTIETLGSHQGNSYSLTANEPGVYPYTLTATTTTGCTYEHNGEISVTTTHSPPELPAYIVYCEGSTATIDLGAYLSLFNISIEAENLNEPIYTFPGQGVYTFTFASECASYMLDVEVEEGQASILMQMSDEICLGSEVEVLLPDWPSISTEADLTIDFGNGTPIPVNGSVMTTTYTSSGNFTVNISGFIGQCEAFTAKEVSVVEDLPEFNLIPEVDICEGDSFRIDFSLFDFSVENAQGIVIENFETVAGGTYFFTALNACGAIERTLDIHVIGFNPLPFGLQQQICPNRDTVSIGFHNENLAILWSNGANSPTIPTNVEGAFVATISDSSGRCSRDYTFMVENLAYNPRNVWPDETIRLCEEGQRTVHPAFIGVPYTFPDGSAGFNFYVEESGWVEVEYHDQCYTYQEAVMVELVPCLCPVWIPNAFTPDGDGNNDLFFPIADCPVHGYHLQIFDRWGKLVFESRDIHEGWNGSSPHIDYYAQNSMYTYLIRYKQKLDDLEIPKEIKGHLSLLR